MRGLQRNEIYIHTYKHIYTTHNPVTLVSSFDKCITWRWSLWTKTWCKQISHIHSKQPLVVTRLFFFFFFVVTWGPMNPRQYEIPFCVDYNNTKFLKNIWSEYSNGKSCRRNKNTRQTQDKKQRAINTYPPKVFGFHSAFNIQHSTLAKSLRFFARG